MNYRKFEKIICMILHWILTHSQHACIYKRCPNVVLFFLTKLLIHWQLRSNLVLGQRFVFFVVFVNKYTRSQVLVLSFTKVEYVIHFKDKCLSQYYPSCVSTKQGIYLQFAQIYSKTIPSNYSTDYRKTYWLLHSWP